MEITITIDEQKVQDKVNQAVDILLDVAIKDALTQYCVRDKIKAIADKAFNDKVKETIDIAYQNKDRITKMCHEVMERKITARLERLMKEK